MLIAGAWAGFRAYVPSAGSMFPFVFSIVCGLLITIPSIIEDVKGQPFSAWILFLWIRGFVVGFLNSMVLFFSVIGVSPNIKPPPGPGPTTSTTTTSPLTNPTSTTNL
jgi:hypothetical protein